MGRYPPLRSRRSDYQTIDTFLGYNHNLRQNPGEFYDMKNMSSDLAPVASTRKLRTLVSSHGNFQGLACRDGLVYVDGKDIVINGNRTDLGLSTASEDCPKQLISMGAYIVVMPDKKYLNTINPLDSGSIEAFFESQAPVTLTPCRADGTPIRAQYIQPTQPEKADDKAVWVDTSTGTHVFKEYSFSVDMWIVLSTLYVKISTPGIGAAFKVDDGVNFSGFRANSAPDSGIQEQIKELDGSAILYSVDTDSVVVVGLLDSEITLEDTIKMSRDMPDMDFVVESKNRLWGCRYGLNKKGEVVNELYACRLGDFKNWAFFGGTAIDSYIVSLGTDGPFTGAVSYGGYPVFFKENCLHKVFGSMPANFQVQDAPCRGVQQGCSRSLAIVDEILYYKSAGGICAYDGSLPAEISHALGDVQYSDAVAAGYDHKYYVSMKGIDGWSLFAYDVQKGLWHREDDLHAYLMTGCREDVFCIDDTGRMLALLGTAPGEQEPADLPWMLETGLIGASAPGHKYLKKLEIRMVLDPGSQVTAYAQYDSEPIWENLWTVEGVDLRSFEMPVVPQRCDHMRLKLEGTGRAMIFAVTSVMTGGA